MSNAAFVDEETRKKIIRLAALALIKNDVPGAPSAAVGPPSKWWIQAENVVDAILPYIKEALRRDV